MFSMHNSFDTLIKTNDSDEEVIGVLKFFKSLYLLGTSLCLIIIAVNLFEIVQGQGSYFKYFLLTIVVPCTLWLGTHFLLIKRFLRNLKAEHIDF